MFCLSFRDTLIHTIFSFLPPQVSFRSAFPNNRSKFLFRPSGLWFWPNLCIQEVRQCCCSYYLPVEEEKKTPFWLRTIVAGSIRYAIILVAQSNKPFFLKVKLSMGGWGGDSLETLMLLRSSIVLRKVENHLPYPPPSAKGHVIARIVLLRVVARQPNPSVSSAIIIFAAVRGEKMHRQALGWLISILICSREATSLSCFQKICIFN